MFMAVSSIYSLINLAHAEFIVSFMYKLIPLTSSLARNRRGAQAWKDFPLVHVCGRGIKG